MRREERRLPDAGSEMQRSWSSERGEGWGMGGWRWGENADLRGNGEDGVNDFSLAEKAEGHLSDSACSLTSVTTAVSFYA